MDLFGLLFILDKIAKMGEMPFMASIRTASPVSNLERRAHSDLPSVPASDLKNRFGEICQRAAKGAVAITRHQRAEFVLLPIEQYEELQQARSVPLDALAQQFDALVTKMNTPAAKRGVKALFAAKPAALGANAVKVAAARKHGR